MRILLAVDGTPSSDRAVDLLATMGIAADSTVRVVAVDEPNLTANAMSWGTADTDPSGDDRDVRHLRRAIDEAEQQLRLARPGLRVEGLLVRGRPGSSIIDEAEAADADLVVIGTRNHGRLERLLFGTTTGEVVDHAPCSVLVVRGPH
jgi:nucleotide-binding universal stress UspA family protein